MSTELQTLARDEKRREPANDWRGLPQRLARTPHNRRALRCPSALHRTARAHMAELPPQAMDTADDGAAALRQLLADADLQRLWEACVNVGAKNVEDLRLADRGPDPKPGLSSAPVCAGRCHGRRGAAAGVIR